MRDLEMLFPMNNEQHRRWSRAFSGDDFYYGQDAGPVARRAVRYHKPLIRLATMPSALDAGCGEGQDLAFLAACGYSATGIDFTSEGIAKTQRLLRERCLLAQTVVADLAVWQPPRRYDLVLAVNCLQFLGEAAPRALEILLDAVAPHGVFGISVFARDDNRTDAANGVYFWTLEELMQMLNPPQHNAEWQMLEAAQLWQWNEPANAPQPFVTVIARKL